jgi:hypothetical protein
VAAFSFNVEAASHQAAGGEADALTGSDDQVVEDPDFDERQGCCDGFGDGFVRLAGLWDAAGVIVHQHHRCGFGEAAKGFFDDHAWEKLAAVDRAAGVLADAQNPVAIVEVADVEFFVAQVPQPHAEELLHAGRVGDCSLAVESSGQDVFGGGQDLFFGLCAGQCVVAQDVSHLIFHVYSPRRWIAPRGQIGEEVKARHTTKPAT